MRMILKLFEVLLGPVEKTFEVQTYRLAKVGELAQRIYPNGPSGAIYRVLRMTDAMTGSFVRLGLVDPDPGPDLACLTELVYDRNWQPAHEWVYYGD